MLDARAEQVHRNNLGEKFLEAVPGSGRKKRLQSPTVCPGSISKHIFNEAESVILKMGGGEELERQRKKKEVGKEGERDRASFPVSHSVL